MSNVQAPKAPYSITVTRFEARVESKEIAKKVWELGKYYQTSCGCLAWLLQPALL